MSIYGGNSGYIGYSMSKRAKQARNQGIFPKTDFKKEYGISERLFKIFTEIDCIYVSEWHHTSKFGNATDFYDWRDGALDIWESNQNEIKKLARKMKKSPRLMDFPATVEGMNQYTEACLPVREWNDGIVKQIREFFEGE